MRYVRSCLFVFARPRTKLTPLSSGLLVQFIAKGQRVLRLVCPSTSDVTAADGTILAQRIQVRFRFLAKRFLKLNCLHPFAMYLQIPLILAWAISIHKVRSRLQSRLLHSFFSLISFLPFRLSSLKGRLSRGSFLSDSSTLFPVTFSNLFLFFFYLSRYLQSQGRLPKSVRKGTSLRRRFPL